MLDRAIGLFGLALALILGVWGLAPEGWPKMPAWATLSGIGVGILLVGLAAGLIIADRRNVHSIAVVQRPEFHLTVPGANIFIPDAQPAWTGIGVDARIWNTGAPSIATDWSMQIVPNGGDVVNAQLTAMPNVLSATGPFNSAKLLAANSLEAKTRDTPVGAVPVDGVLLFYVALPKATVQAPDTRWEITVKDIYENKTQVTKLMGDWLHR
jgi:hypothetical protein